MANNTPVITNDLASFFTSGNVLPELKAGIHKAKLASATLVPAKGNSDPYVRLELDLADRRIVDNRFNVGFKLMCSQMHKQFGLTSAIPVQDMLKRMQTEEFNIWIEHVTYTSATKGKVSDRNVLFMEPLPKEIPTEPAEPVAPLPTIAPAVVEDDDSDLPI